MSAAVATPTEAYHFSKREIVHWGNFTALNKTSRSKIGKTGKPVGFWYAYATTWANTISGMGSVAMNTLKFKYKFPLHGFTDDVSSTDSSLILRLSNSNLQAFLMAFHKPEFFVEPRKLLDQLMYEYLVNGESAINLLLDHETLVGFVKQQLGEGDNDDEPEPEVMEKYLRNFWTPIPYDKCTEFANALINMSHQSADYSVVPIPYYKWNKFWENVSQRFAGVEFTQDLIYPRDADRIFIEFDTGRPDLPYAGGLDVSWLRLLDVVSGCIFDPATYFGDKTPPDFKETNTATAGAATRTSSTARRGGTRRFGKKRSVRRHFSRKVRR